jgi:hypothetical protein
LSRLTGKFADRLAADPVVFWLSVGNVQLAKLPEAGVPSAGVTSVGLVESTTDPEPVEDVTPVPPFNTGNCPDTADVKLTCPQEGAAAVLPNNT